MILVVDDEKNIVDIISYNLKKEGFEVRQAFDGKSGLELALEADPELVLLDIMMPEMDGFEVCRRIRENNNNVPIIMLTARVEEVDKIMGLEVGADDYVTKPFGVKELMARVKANLRRREMDNEEQNGDILVFGELVINLSLYEIRRSKQIIELTRREFDLLKYMALQNNQVFTREALLADVWGYDYLGDPRTVDVTIRRLRMKLEVDPDNPKYILTRRTVGYYFVGKDDC
ncbi:MAG: response regulator transcription factor [Turicibacter sp.]|nr:response regulator transcription factor [Turicibacter sp.]